MLSRLAFRSSANHQRGITDDARADAAARFRAGAQRHYRADTSAISVAGYERSEAPEAMATKAPQTVPCFLLARLAVDLEWQGRGLGWGLLRDAIMRALTLSQSVAAPALLVHARDDGARAFYLHHAEFLQSPVEPLHLFLPMKAIAARFDSL